MEVNLQALNNQFDALVSASQGGQEASAQARAAKTTPVEAPPLETPAAIKAYEAALEKGDGVSFLEDLAGQMNQVVNELGISIRYKIQLTDSGQYYVEVRDRYSGQLVKTIPPENLVNLKEKLQNEFKGGLVNERI
ncbi:MAG: flagellar protein FlaG [Planctomycetes bacterium]|nr:flagellar protein FlaG [Planctomycetota bacterium]